MKEEEKELIKELSQGEKICPLRSMITESGYCFGEMCALWDENNKKCSIATTAQIFETVKELTKSIDEILANMHEVLTNLNDLLRELTEEEYYLT